MTIVTMYRGEEVASVDTSQIVTYENFLSHGWAVVLEEETPLPKVVEVTSEAEDLVEEEKLPETEDSAPAELAKTTKTRKSRDTE